MKKLIFSAASVFIILLLWLILQNAVDSQLILPDMKSVCFSIAGFLKNNFFYECLIETIFRIFSAFFISALFGFVIGLFCSLNKSVETFFELPLAFLRSVPVAAVILILIFWTDSNWTPVICSILMCLPVMITCSKEGLKKQNTQIDFMCRIFEITKFQKFIFYNLPEAKNSLNEGLKNICGLCWKVVCASEVLCLPKKSLGLLLQNNQVLLESSNVFALTVLIVFFSYIFSKIVLFAFNVFCRLYFLFVKIYFHSFSVKSPDLNFSSSDINIENLSITKNNVPIYNKFFCSFKAGSINKISGESGKGKTTLLNYIAENSFGNKVSFAFQENTCFNSLTVLQNIQLPLLRIFGSEKSKVIVHDIIEKLNLSERANFYPYSISTGQKQRMNIARSFCFPASLYLLDEIYSSQDIASIEKINLCLNEICSKGNKTVIFCSHSESVSQSVNSINISN